MKRVLVLDDEPHLRAFLADGLKAEGYIVECVAQVVDALRILGWMEPEGGKERRVPDLLIVDWKMPGYDGTELLYLLRSQARFAALPILFMGQRSPLYEVRGYLEGLPWRPDGIIYKPFSLRELLPLVRELLAEPRDQSLPLRERSGAE